VSEHNVFLIMDIRSLAVVMHSLFARYCETDLNTLMPLRSDGKLHMTKKKQFKLKKKARVAKMGTGNAFHGKGKKGRHGK